MTPAPIARRLLLAAGAALLLAASAARAQELPDADALFARGVAAATRRATSWAPSRSTRPRSRRTPARVDARSNLGAAYARLGRYDDAASTTGRRSRAMPDQGGCASTWRSRSTRRRACPRRPRSWSGSSPRSRAHRSAVLLLADCRLQIGATRRRGRAADAARGGAQGRPPVRLPDGQRPHPLATSCCAARPTSTGCSARARRAEARLLMGAAHLRRNDSRAALPELERAARG